MVRCQCHKLTRCLSVQSVGVVLISNVLFVDLPLSSVTWALVVLLVHLFQRVADSPRLGLATYTRVQSSKLLLIPARAHVTTWMAGRKADICMTNHASV